MPSRFRRKRTRRVQAHQGCKEWVAARQPNWGHSVPDLPFTAFPLITCLVPKRAHNLAQQ